MFPPISGYQKRIIGGIITVFVFTAIGFALWNTRESPPIASVSILPETGTALEPIATSAPRRSPAPAVPPAAPLYRGAPVNLLAADSEVVRQIPPQTYEQSKTELADLAVKLASNPRDKDGWMRVAFIKRFYHDYPGARDAYEYLNRVAEEDPIPFYNLGSLYGYYLKEPSRAVPKYEAAIQRDSHNTSFYSGFADFYREVLRDFSSAEKIFLQGLEKVPTDVNLMTSLASLYEGEGKTAQAITYYERALAEGVADGQRRAVVAALDRLKAASSAPR